jgi:hypothetical protein
LKDGPRTEREFRTRSALQGPFDQIRRRLAHAVCSLRAVMPTT